ncbi:MAG: AMP-dependent synthetase/ligase [Nitriliruptoraceae bacterium]
MPQFTSDGEIVVSHDENLTDLLWEFERTHPQRPALAYREDDTFVTVSTATFVAHVRQLAKGLIGLGITPGDRVAIHAETRWEWTVLDFAIWAAGGVTVPLYETASAQQINWILTDASVVLVVSANDELADIVATAATNLTTCRYRFTLSQNAFELIAANGNTVDDTALEERAKACTGSDIATIVYTSGTTGTPKGCVITHHNMIWDAEQIAAAERSFLYPGRRTLLFLPLAHIFARVIQVTGVRHGIHMGYASSVEKLKEELGLFQPDFLIGVPRVFEKVFNNARMQAAAHRKERLFDAAAATAIAYSTHSQDGQVPVALRLKHAVFDLLVYKKLRRALGGKVTHVVSGGAALGARLAHFFTGAGITVMEGYGLTESTAAATLGTPEMNRIGTVGRAVPGGSVRLAADGELELAGANIFTGYYNQPEETAAVFTDDGWFRTGDIAQIDEEGFVTITGRKKEMIVTANGKNVAPTPLEDTVRAHALVSQCVVIGDDKAFISALVTLDPEATMTWLKTQKDAADDQIRLHEHPAVLAELQTAIDRANASVSRAESIRTFRVLERDFVVGEELSQKMSVRRHIVSERYAQTIASIYASSNNKEK